MTEKWLHRHEFSGEFNRIEAPGDRIEAPGDRKVAPGDRIVASGNRIDARIFRKAVLGEKVRAAPAVSGGW